MQWIQASLNSKSALLHKCTRQGSLSTQQDRWANVHTLALSLCTVAQSTHRWTQMSNMVTRSGFHQSLFAIRQNSRPSCKRVSAFFCYCFCLVLVLFSLFFFSHTLIAALAKFLVKQKLFSFLLPTIFCFVICVYYVSNDPLNLWVLIWHTLSLSF